MTPLDKTLKRLLNIKGDDFVVTLTPDALKLTRKGHQRGVEILWESLVNGEAALAVALRASVGKFAGSPRAERNTAKRKTPNAPPANASRLQAEKKRSRRASRTSR